MSNDKSKIKILVKNSSWLYYGKIASQIFNIVISILVIKKLDVEMYGTYTLLINSFVVFQIFGSGQISILLNRYIPELFATNQFNKLKRLILYGLLYSCLVLSILSGLLYLLRQQYADFFNVPNFHMYLKPFLFYIFWYFFFIVFKAITSSLLLQKEISIITLMQALVRLFLYLYFLSELTIIILLYIEGVIAIIFIIGSQYVLYKFHKRLDYKIPVDDNIPSVTKSRIIKFGLLGSLNELGSGIIGGTSDFFIVSAMGNPYSVGLYAFAFRIKAVVSNIFPLQEFQTVIRPLFFQKFTKSYDRESFVWLYNFMIKALMPVLLIPMLYFLIFGKEIILYIFDAEYLEAYIVTCIVIFGHMINGIFYPVGITIHLKERMEIALYSKVVVVISILAGILGMEYFGIEGVAIASILGNFLKNVFMIVLIKKFADIKYRLFEYKNYLIQAGILLAIFYFINNLIYDLISLLILSCVFGVAALLLLILLHPFNKKDLELIFKISQSSKLLMVIQRFVVKIYSLKRNFQS